MVYKKGTLLIIALIIAGFLLYFSLRTYSEKSGSPSYITEQAQKNMTTQVITAPGYVEPQEEIRLSSLIPGIIRKMYVKENEFVKKGQLLVDIDDGREDTNVKVAQADLQKSQSILTYQAAFYERQKQLHDGNHISKDAFQQAIQDYKVALRDVELKEAVLEKEQILFSRKKITSPVDGVIIQKVGAEGEAIILDNPSPHIYRIAKDIKKMKIQLKIDEKHIVHIKEKAKVRLIFTAYPHKVFTGVITTTSKAPHHENGSIHYLATILLDNTNLLFLPGMTVTAHITVGEKEQAANPEHTFLNSQLSE